MFIAFTESLQRVPNSAWVTGGGMAFIAFFAGMAFANGVLKQVINALSIVVSIFVAWTCFRNRTEVFGGAAASMDTDRLMLFCGLAGIITYVLCRLLLRVLTTVGLLGFLANVAGWKGLALSVFSSGFMLWVASLALRLVGNLYGLETASALAREGTRIQSTVGSWASGLGRMVDKSTVGNLISHMDPFDIRPTSNLARLLIVWPDQRVWAQLASNEKTGIIYRQERVVLLGQDPAVQKCIHDKDFAGLMQLPQVEKTAAHPDLKPLLTDVGLEDAMDQILYGRVGNKR
jgi:hypothetical protein